MFARSVERLSSFKEVIFWTWVWIRYSNRWTRNISRLSPGYRYPKSRKEIEITGPRLMIFLVTTRVWKPGTLQFYVFRIIVSSPLYRHNAIYFFWWYCVACSTLKTLSTIYAKSKVLVNGTFLFNASCKQNDGNALNPFVNMKKSIDIDARGRFILSIQKECVCKLTT